MTIAVYGIYSLLLSVTSASPPYECVLLQDCVRSEWSEWTGCSGECGTHSQRWRGDEICKTSIETKIRHCNLSNSDLLQTRSCGDEFCRQFGYQGNCNHLLIFFKKKLYCCYIVYH